MKLLTLKINKYKIAENTIKSPKIDGLFFPYIKPKIKKKTAINVYLFISNPVIALRYGILERKSPIAFVVFISLFIFM